MKALSTIELFSIWEENMEQPLLSKTITLLQAACAVNDNLTIAKLSIGERDARLFLLREWMFGNRMYHTTNCPVCTEKVEWETRANAMRIQELDDSFSTRIFELSSQDFYIKYRLVNSLDIIQLLKQKIALEEANGNLLKCCMLDIKKQGKSYSIDKLPAALVVSIEEEMAQKDPQADLQLQVSCPACNHEWTVGFDIMHFFWTEIHNWAQRLMQEVFLLARFFNWSEKDILNMSPRRRQLYLQMLNV